MIRITRANHNWCMVEMRLVQFELDVMSTNPLTCLHQIKLHVKIISCLVAVQRGYGCEFSY